MEPQENQFWRHRKGGDYYIVAIAKLEADQTPVVVYKNCESREIWVRPVDEFMDGRFRRMTRDEWKQYFQHASHT